MNILHLVLAAKTDHYSPIIDTAKKTWMKNSPKNIKTIFMYGGSDKIYWDNKDSFYVNRPESLDLCFYKIICAYETFLETDFDYIFRSNCTGYFDLINLNKFIENKPLKNFYCGCNGVLNGVNFASGSGYFISKDLVESIVENKHILFEYGMPGYFDDVAIGKFITQYLNVEIDDSARRIDLSPNQITDDLDMSHYHYRILNSGNCESLQKIYKLKNKK
jgi:hypothetical protein